LRIVIEFDDETKEGWVELPDDRRFAVTGAELSLKSLPFVDWDATLSENNESRWLAYKPGPRTVVFSAFFDEPPAPRGELTLPVLCHVIGDLEMKVNELMMLATEERARA